MKKLCADCEAELDHCHGTLIVHQEGVRECTDFDCFVFDTARHALVIDCTSLNVDCECLDAHLLTHRRSA